MNKIIYLLLLTFASCIASSLPLSLRADTIGDTKTSIEAGDYALNDKLTSIEIPNSVTSIGDYAFSFCHSLKSIKIPNSVTSIGDGAFLDCESLTTIEIPSSVTRIGDGAFSGCKSLESIIVASDNASFRSIDGILFNKNADTLIAYPCGKKELSYQIPSGVTSIGNQAFGSCSSLTSIKIPNSVTSIGNGMFWGCTSLTSVEIPNSVTNIGNGMFWGCTSLTSIEIPNSVTSIGNQAFNECTSLISIEIPNSVARIEREAFDGCYSLEQINVAKDNPYFVANDGVLFDKSLTKLIAYPTGKASVSYVIPEGVLTIEPMAFFDCKHLVSVTLPESMEPNFRFYHCTHLREIHLRNKFPTSELERRRSWYFKECTLYIPKGSEEAYSKYNLEEIFKEVKTE